MSDSMRPHRWQPTRLLSLDSPGKNTGVGCHFLLRCMKMKSEREVAQSCPTLCDPMDRSLPGSSIHGIFQARVLEWGAIAFSNMVKLGPQIIVCCLLMCAESMSHRSLSSRAHRAGCGAHATTVLLGGAGLLLLLNGFDLLG